MTMTATAADVLLFERLLDRVETNGNVPAAVWPCSDFLASLSPRVRDGRGVVACVIDDDPALAGTTFAGLEVVTSAEALSRGVRSVIGCAPRPLQDRLFASRGPLRAGGVQILWCPARFGGKPWDEGLCALWDFEQAVRNGLKPAWKRVYPPRDHALPGGYAGYLRERTAGKRVLEVGSGHGLVTAELIDGASAYTCVDFSDRLLFEVVEHRFFERLEKLTLIHDESARLAGVADGSVDFAFSFDAFVHLHPDVVHQYLASFGRVLAPGGRVHLHVRTWDAAEIGVWEEAYQETCVGKWNLMGYNSIETLTASADHLGLRIERVGADDGKGMLEGWTGYLVEFSKI